MQRRSSLKGMVLATALFLTSAGTAQAATLYAGPIPLEGYTYVECSLLNTGKGTLRDMSIHATVENHGTRGLSARDRLPGRTGKVGKYNNGPFSNLGWCKFEFKGSSKNVSATLCVTEPYDNNCKSAVPAQ